MNNHLVCQTIIGLFVVCLAALDISAQENFKGIIPMVTTKAEVEKILRKADEYGDYELEEGRVHVDYYDQECEKKIECFCLVPLGRVRYVSVTLYYDLYLKDLNLDLQKYKETRSTHLPDVFTYSNSKTGVVYEVQSGKVSRISYYESEDTCNEIKQKFLTTENQIKSSKNSCIPNLELVNY